MCQQHISAFVYDKRGRLLSTGQNSYVKTHPLQAKAAREVGEPHRIFLHAEVAALLKCDWGKAHRMFVARYGKDGRPLLADRKSTRLNSSHVALSRMPSSA